MMKVSFLFLAKIAAVIFCAAALLVSKPLAGVSLDTQTGRPDAGLLSSFWVDSTFDFKGSSIEKKTQYVVPVFDDQNACKEQEIRFRSLRDREESKCVKEPTLIDINEQAFFTVS